MISTKRRGFAVLAVFAMMVSACGGATPSGSPAGSAAPGKSAPAQSAGAATGRLHVRRRQRADHPRRHPGRPADHRGSPSSCTDALPARLQARLRSTPWAAGGPPETSTDGLTWTDEAQDRHQVPRRQRVTSADVKFSFDLMGSPNCRENPDTARRSRTTSPPSTSPTRHRQVPPQAEVRAVHLRAAWAHLILPKKALEDSFARFQTAAGAVDKEEVTAWSRRSRTAPAPITPPARSLKAHRLPTPACSPPTRPISRSSSATPASSPSTRRVTTRPAIGHRLRPRGVRPGAATQLAGPRQVPRPRRRSTRSRRPRRSSTSARTRSARAP